MPHDFHHIFVVHMQCRVTLIEERFVFEIVKTYFRVWGRRVLLFHEVLRYYYIFRVYMYVCHV